MKHRQKRLGKKDRASINFQATSGSLTQLESPQKKRKMRKLKEKENWEKQ